MSLRSRSRTSSPNLWDRRHVLPHVWTPFDKSSTIGSQTLEGTEMLKLAEQPYQLLPELPSWEYHALKESIRRHGVLLPVIKDDKGKTIDGHHRERACRELGIADYPIITLHGLTEDQKRDHALLLNLVRRKVTRRQLREIIAAELRRTPDISSNWLAEILGTSDKTVEAVREHLIGTSEIPKCQTHRGKDGRQQRVTRVVTFRSKDAERAREAIAALGDDVPARPIELRLIERRARKKEKLEEINERLAQPRADDSIRLFHCPFQDLERVADIQPGSVNLVLTDIPYGREFLPQLPDLAASRPSESSKMGIFCCYSGVAFLDHVSTGLYRESDLPSRRLLLVVGRWARPPASLMRHPGHAGRHLLERGVANREAVGTTTTDATVRSKTSIPGRRCYADMEHWVESFTGPDDLVCDPLAGSFTAAVACEKMARRFVGCDQEERNVLVGQRRLREFRAASG